MHAYPFVVTPQHTYSTAFPFSYSLRYKLHRRSLIAAVWYTEDTSTVAASDATIVPEESSLPPVYLDCQFCVFVAGE